jgi:signal transduction histidine kinase
VTLTSGPRPTPASAGAQGSQPYPPWPFGPAVWALQDRRQSWPVLVLPMVALAVIQVVGTKLAANNQPDARTLDALGYALLIAGPAVAILRRHFPVPVLIAVASITLGYLSLGYPYGPIFLSLIGAVFSAVLSGHRRAAWATVGLGFVGYAALTYTIDAGHGSPPLRLAGVFAWLLVVIVVAELVRSQRERFAEAMRMRAEEGRRRASEERLGFARELHDVLAHNISLINVQAGVALHLIDTQPEQARAALAAIKDASKETLRELRATLGVLRQVDEGVPRAPAPSLARLDELIARLGVAGLTVRTRIEGAPVPLPARVDLAAYRIVQEALTNVYRHAGPVTATVEIGYAEDELVIQVDNDAGATGAVIGNAAAGLPSTGTGIAGMRERAETLGGELSAGPRPGGGFRVRARLPLDGVL